MKHSFEGAGIVQTKYHELTPHEAALYLIFTEDVQAAVATYQKVASLHTPRDFASSADVPLRVRAEEELQAVLARNGIILKPVLTHGFDISLEEFITEFTAHRTV